MSPPDLPARPQPPRPPEPAECCQSGCEPCVYDRYWEAMTRYEAELAAWEQSLTKASAP